MRNNFLPQAIYHILARYEYYARQELSPGDISLLAVLKHHSQELNITPGKTVSLAGIKYYNWVQVITRAEWICSVMAPDSFRTTQTKWCLPSHYNDAIMSAMASLITSLTIVYSTVIQAQIKENIKAPRHWPLCGEFTGDRWIPRTNGQ